MPDYDWQRIIQLIPGYDPVATAGLEDATWEEVCDPAYGDYWFDEDAAAFACGFFPDMLFHIKGSKARGHQPFDLELWEQAIIANLFGWKLANGLRRYREAFCEVGRKNGKTPLAAGIAAYMLFADGEPGVEVYLAAADMDGTREAWDHLYVWAKENPEFARACRPLPGYKSVQLNESAGVARCISSDSRRGHSYNTHAAIIDEVHLHKTRDLIDALQTSVGAREQPLIFQITTSDQAGESICNEQEEYAEKVRDGIIEDPRFLPILYVVDKEDDWTDPEVWKKANPNLGVSKQWEYMERQCKKAQDNPAYENTFKRLDLNIQTQQAERIIPMEWWDACGGSVVEGALYGQACYGALDLSSTLDMTAWVMLFEGNRVLARFFLPEATLRERPDFVGQWVDAGHITVTPGETVDYEFVRQTVNEDGEKFEIQEIGYDPWNATQLATQLAEEDGFEMVQFRQGYKSMNEPTKALLGLLKSGKLQHGGNPVLRWMASNVAATEDAAGNLKPHKGKSGGRIDGIVALVMCIGLAALGAAPQQSVYEERGLLTV